MSELHDELHRHYGLLLGIKSPWEVHEVNLDMAGRRVEIRLEWATGNTVTCPECGKQCTAADHAPERTWRHLDTMRFETLIRARVPRPRCPQDGVKLSAMRWRRKDHDARNECHPVFHKSMVDLCYFRSDQRFGKVFSALIRAELIHMSR